MYTSCDKTAVHITDCETGGEHCTKYYNSVIPLLAEFDDILSDLEKAIPGGAMDEFNGIIDALNAYKEALEEIR